MPAGPTTTESVRSVESLSVPEDVAVCVERSLGGDDHPASDVQYAVAECQGSLVFGPEFVRSLAADFPGLYTDAQLRCLEGSFAALEVSQTQALLDAAIKPELQGERAHRDAVDALFGTCDVEPPAAD